MKNLIEELEKKLLDEQEPLKKIDLMNDLSYELRRSDTKKAFVLANEAYNTSVKSNYKKGLAESLTCIATIDSSYGHVLEAIEKLNKASIIYEELDYTEGKIKTLNSLGYNYSHLGRYEKSIEYYLQGLSLAKKNNYVDSKLIFLLNNIGELYKNVMNMYEEALGYYFEAVEYCKEFNSPYLWPVYNNIGDTYLLLNNVEKALEYCNMALEGTHKTKDKLTEAHCYKSLGKIYEHLKIQDETIGNFHQSFLLYKQIGNKLGETQILIELGNFFIHNENYNSALDYMLQALESTKETHADSFLEAIHKSLAEIYEKLKYYEKSVFHYKNYIIHHQDSVSSELENKLNALLIETKMKQAEQDMEIYKLKNVELREKSEEIEKKAKQLEESYKNMYIISEIGQKITSSLEIETIMNTIYESINLLMDAAGFGIGLYDETNKKVDYKMFIENGNRLPRFITPIDEEKSFASKCIISGKEIFINDAVIDSFNFIPDDSSDANDTPPRSLIYYPLTIEGKVIGTITVQSYIKNAYSEHNLDTVKALASYVAIAINNSQKSEEIKKSAEELSTTLKDLQDTQEYLINSEKMVALGQLISGIAHEINTPLGAIQASLSNISEYMEHTIGEKIPAIFRLLNPIDQNKFFEMLQDTMLKDITISSREERKSKRVLSKQLEDLNIDHYDSLSDTMVDMGIYFLKEEYLPLLTHPDSDFIIQTCYEISGILRNIKNMELAVGKAAKILYALKSYSHTAHVENPVETDITVGIDTVLALYYNNIKQGTELIKNYSQIPKIKCLPDELNQVWTNLIHNALQAMDYKGILEINVHQEDTFIVVNLSDTGKGIPPELIGRIFEPFFTTKRQGEGSGLGLGIVKKIIDKHKGTIDVKSLPGKTTFTVKLPIN
jgi:signal transduction histidine kinase